MKKFYKLTTAFLSFVMLLPLGTIHAAAYDDCDVNHDGVVDVSDVVILSEYLSGEYYISDYNRFDTNKSMTVDSADVDKILAKIANKTYSASYLNMNNNYSCVSFPTISGFTPDPHASATGSRTYRRYSWSQHQELAPYTLSPTAGTLGTSQPSNPSREIIGTDNRYQSTAEENTGIVLLDGRGGTGFIVGDHVIATAAHCVYQWNTNGGYFKTGSLTIKTYDFYGELSNTTLTPKEIHVPSAYGAASETDKWNYDYALITVSEDLSSYTHFCLGTSYNLTATNYATVPLYVLGPHMTGNDMNLYYGQGNVIDDAYGICMNYNCDTLPGDSGAPVYTITVIDTANDPTSYVFTALAIHTTHTSTYNSGTRITKYHLQFFDENTNTYISYT